ncbi:MAG: A/G-specific adenine glycosylase [Rhodospirillaceae bacterium]
MVVQARAQDLLKWYDRHRRSLPWRVLPGEVTDPYAVWLSEIMLQQTTVMAVKPYFRRFLERWPTVESLAAAGLDEILTEWAGLGYYARARNLHACAKLVTQTCDGRFPSNEADLKKLPGIGEYTAAAVTAIAFNRYAIVVDANVERVMARLHAVMVPLPKAKRQLKDFAAVLTPKRRPGDYAQAVMDLGATVCTPKSPSCSLCPWQKPCAARRLGIAAELPLKAPKTERPVRKGTCFWLTRPDGAILLRRRPETGLLGGMMEIPSTPWLEAGLSADDTYGHAPIVVTESKWRRLPGIVTHAFTHFHLELCIEMALITATEAEIVRKKKDLMWVHLDAMGDHALPSVMRKVAKHAIRTGY